MITEFVKFCCVGLINATLNLTCFYIAISLDINYLLAGLIGFLAGGFSGFIINRKHTFNHNITFVDGITYYLCAGAAALMVHTLSLYTLHEFLLFERITSQIIAILPSTIVNFVLIKKTVFR